MPRKPPAAPTPHDSILDATAKAHSATLVAFRLVTAAYPTGSPEWQAAFAARHALLDLFDLLNGRRP